MLPLTRKSPSTVGLTGADRQWHGIAARGRVGTAAPGASVDLGAGTGLLAAMLRPAHPDCVLTLVDLSPAMLDEAKRRFAGSADFTYEVADYAQALPEGPFDLVVSALSIHHLVCAGPGRSVRQRRPGVGTYCGIGDPCPHPLAGPGGRPGVGQGGARGAEERMTHDRCATLEAQLAWLRDANFTDVDCALKAWRFAVYSGRRPAG